MFIIFLLVIHSSIQAPIQLDNTTVLPPVCQQTITYEEIFEILVHTQCTSSTNHRLRRSNDDDQTVASTNNIYALQSTINDHRTMIDDHRKMIHYLINNTVNVTHLNQYYADQHASTRPIWRSWRDLCLLLLIFIFLLLIIIFVIKRVKPMDRLTAILLRRHEQKQKTEEISTIDNQQRQHRRLGSFTTVPLSNNNSIKRDYINPHYGSNSSF